MKTNSAKENLPPAAIVIAPVKGLKGEITVPGDKSISHRAVILGSIADGTTEVNGFLEGEDNHSTIKAFRAMGVSIEHSGEGSLKINGCGIYGLSEPEDVIDAGNSGTTARILMGLLSAQHFFSAVTGDGSLRKRPMKRVIEPLLRMGASITGRRGGDLLPVAITGRPLKGINYSTPVASAQLKSAVLLAGIYAEGETSVEEPERSRDHTERMLRLFGADLIIRGKKVKVNSTKSLNGCKIDIPGDISSSAFFMVGAAISRDSELLIKNVGINPTRTGIIDILRKMGSSIVLENEREVSGEPVADIIVRNSRLKAVSISGEELLPAIDEFPIICIAAACADGVTEIRGASELRVKESDRISVMAESLHSIGVKSEERPDGILIQGMGGKLLDGGKIKSHGDHRIAMAMAMAGLHSAKGMEIEDFECANVSFPGFFSLLHSVGRP